MERAEERAFVLAIIVLLQILVTDQGVAYASFVDADGNVCLKSDPLMDPTYEVRYGQDVVWQIPSNPKAVLFMAHGMDKEPLSYFDSGPNCKECYGFPEDRAVVLAALRRSYAVIVVKSESAYWLPWGIESWPPAYSKDRVVVPRIIKEWTKEHSLEHLPFGVFGYSSGGNFSTLLTLDLDVQSLVLMCTSGEFMVLEHANSQFPPTLYVNMPVDNGPVGYYTLGEKAAEILMSKGVMVRKFYVYPRPVTTSFFTERIPCFSASTSEKIYAAFKAEGWLDENDYLVFNPRIADWESVLWKWRLLPFCKSWNDLCCAQHVKQELLMAYAEHSMTSLADDVVYNWLDGTLFPSPSNLTELKSSA